MLFSPIPYGPWYNPDLKEGVYDATIQTITIHPYKQEGEYIQVLLWLPGVQKHLVTNSYLPPNQSQDKTMARLLCLCRCVGMVPQQIRDDPSWFDGEELQITVKRITGIGINEGKTYSDADLFFPAGTHETTEQTKVEV